ncbi:MAG: aminotransferase class V-fold PLP-dependent enzyme, partial [Elusimicrobiota bacterium]|nr:aminotransferase class V-fold PLP-dependent enzyme [Elusimicrobiota bacterium]
MNKISLAEDTISSDELSDLADWIKTNKRLTKGPLCLEFEYQFALWQGSKYAVFVNSGSSANLLIAQALLESKFLHNKRVIVPAVSWCTTVTPFIQLGFEVSLCDCDRDDLGFDIKHFESLCVKEKPALAVLVNVLGHPNKIDEILEICKKYDVLLVEDSCEALGS